MRSEWDIWYRRNQIIPEGATTDENAANEKMGVFMLQSKISSGRKSFHAELAHSL